METDSLVAIARYVEQGEGVSVTIDLPGDVKQRGTRVVPVAGFAPVEVAAWWRDRPGPVASAFVEEAVRLVRKPSPSALPRIESRGSHPMSVKSGQPLPFHFSRR